MSIDVPTVSRLRHKLDSQTDVTSLTSMSPSFTASPSVSIAEIRKTRIAIYVDLGVTKSISSGEKVGLIGALGFEYIDPPLTLDLGLLGIGDGNVADELPGTTVSGGNLVMKILPINTSGFRLGIGGGIGVVHLLEITEDDQYDMYGVQALGVSEMTLFPGKLRLRIKGIYAKTRYSHEAKVPILEEQLHVGSGLFATVGFTVEL